MAHGNSGATRKSRKPIHNSSLHGSPPLIWSGSRTGESLQDIVARTADALRLVLDQHVDDTVVLVGHTSVNRALLVQLLDQPLSAYWRLGQAPCCVNEFDVVGGCITVARINETQ